MAGTKDIVQIGPDLAEALGTSVGKMAAAVTEELRDSTPQDTGHAASNWVIDGQGVYGSKQAVDFATQAASIDAARSNHNIKQPLDINNEVPYIGRLNGGYSPKASAGFVESAITAGIARASGNDETL